MNPIYAGIHYTGKCVCPMCGKQFLRTQHWIYVRKYTVCCSWTCYQKAKSLTLTELKKKNNGQKGLKQMTCGKKVILTTEQEDRVRQMIADGQSYKKISVILGVSECTVARICRDLGISSQRAYSTKTPAEQPAETPAAPALKVTSVQGEKASYSIDDKGYLVAHVDSDGFLSVLTIKISSVPALIAEMTQAVAMLGAGANE